MGSRADSHGRIASWGGATWQSAHFQCCTSRCFPDLALKRGMNSQPTAQNYLCTGEVTYFRSSSDLHLFVPLYSFLQKHGPHAGQHGRTRDFGTGGKGASSVCLTMPVTDVGPAKGVCSAVCSCCPWSCAGSALTRPSSGWSGEDRVEELAPPWGSELRGTHSGVTSVLGAVSLRSSTLFGMFLTRTLL